MTRFSRLFLSLSAALVGLTCLLLPAAGNAAGCPAEDVIAANLEKTFRKKVEVKRVRPASVEGLCEVIVSVQGKASLIYSDSSGRYLVNGQIYDSEILPDLSRTAMAEYNRFTPEEVEKLASLTALSMGESGPVVYFVTDPD